MQTHRGGLSIQSYVNPLKQAPWLNTAWDTDKDANTCSAVRSPSSLGQRTDSFGIFAMTSVIVFFVAFMGGSIQLKWGIQGKKGRLGYESYMFSVRQQKFFISFLPVGLLLPSMLFMKPFISIKEFWGWSFISLFVWRTDIVLFSYSWMGKKAPLFSEAFYK